MHAARTTLMRRIANIRAALTQVRTVAEQLPAADRWKTLLDYIVAKIILHRPRNLLWTCALLPGNCGFQEDHKGGSDAAAVDLGQSAGS
jgi:hypothetical protein